MASLTDIIITIAATENITETFQNIQNSGSKLKSTLGAMATGAGLAMANYGKDAVQSAITAETEWNRFGANLQNQGLDWNNLSSEVKNYISDFSNQMGRGVADTRSAATALMNYGMSWDEVKGSMNGVAGLAASIGGTEEEASQMVVLKHYVKLLVYKLKIIKQLMVVLTVLVCLRILLIGLRMHG